MNSNGRTSVTVLITLAELAWLASFGLLFAYRSKVGELGVLRRELTSAQTNAQQIASQNQELRKRFGAVEDLLRDMSPEQAARWLSDLREFEKKMNESETKRMALEQALAAKTDGEEKARAELAAALAELAKLRSVVEGLPPNFSDVLQNLSRSQTRVGDLEKSLASAETERRQREVGEFSVRRELTGLPDRNLQRVVFLVDTSTSMRNSPAWDAARKLIRTWLEFLPVEECALINFNDNATGFPKEGYHRVRLPDGTRLPAKRDELLAVFDAAQPGTYTDLLRALRMAYGYKSPDIFVLFTDGQPRVAYRRDAAFAREILTEIKNHPSVPILSVALGSYEVEGSGGPQPRTNAPVAFLKELARQSSGAFLAR